MSGRFSVTTQQGHSRLDYARLAMKSRQTGELLSAASINRPLQLLRHLLQLATRRWEVVARVPEIVLEKERRRERFLTPEEARRLLAACRDSKNSELADVVELAIFTGLRQGDVLSLPWSAVDRAQGMLVVAKRQKDDKPHNVPLNAYSDAVLARRCPIDAAAPVGFIFSSQSWDRYRSAWESAVKRAKLADLRFHDLRHTARGWRRRGGRRRRFKRR